MMLVLAVGAAQAQAKPPSRPPTGPAAGGARTSACGIMSLPMAPGNTWGYKSGPKGIVVKVVDVQPGKDIGGKPSSVISVEETYDGRTVKTNWTCTATGGVSVGLESFFFSAEPGGGVGMEYQVTKHEQVTLQPDAALIPDANWIEIYNAKVVRPDGGGAGATHMPAQLELERHVIVHGVENVATSLGQWNAQKITVELRGRGIVDTEKSEIPAKQTGGLWVVKGLGIVRLMDNNDKTWDLVESTLVK
jgi:hypothetical protein